MKSLTLFLITFLSLAFFAEPAQAGPLIGAIGSVISAAKAAWLAIGAMGPLGIAVQRIALGLASSAISRMFRKDPPPPGVMRRLDFGGDRPQRVRLGRYAGAGHLIWSESHGRVGKSPNAYFTEVVLISVLPVSGLIGIQVNGSPATFGETEHPEYGWPVAEYNKGGDHLWVKFYDGTQTAADPMLLAKYGPGIAPVADFAWQADMIGRGCAYAIVTTRGNHDMWGGQTPTVLFETRGARLYDRRADSTAGGLGNQRENDPASWGYSENPIVAAEHVLSLGLSFGSEHIYGPRWPREMFAPSVWVAAANACDAQTPGLDNQNEPFFRFGCDLDLTMEPRAFVRELLKCANADFALCEGKALVHVGAPSAPVVHITDRDISVSHPQELDPFKGLEELFNAASPTFPDPLQNWSMVPAPTKLNPAWETADGGRRTAPMPFPFVPWVSQVQRLVAAALADQRRQLVHRVVLGWVHGHIAPLDYVTWTSARNGYQAKVFKVVTVRDYATGHVVVMLLEEDPADHVPPPLLPHDPPPPLRIERPSQTVTGFNVAPYPVTAQGQPRRAGLLATWAPDAADDARGVRIAIREAGDAGAGDELALQVVAAGRAIVVDSIVAGTAYELRAIYDADRPVGWTPWQAVTAPNIRLSPNDLADDLRDRVDTLRGWIDGGVTDLPQSLTTLFDAAEIGSARWRVQRDQMRRLAGEVIDLAAHDHRAREAIRRDLTAQLGANAAKFAEEIVTLADLQGSTAARVTTLEADGVATNARIDQTELARQQGDDALAALVAAVAVGTATQFDHAVIWYFDSSVENWAGSPTAPTASGGYLRPSEGANLLSPTGLDVAADTYGQARARIRRVGAPTWLGQLWWNALGQNWDVSRCLAIPEPDFVDNVALLTWTPGWSGQIDQIRADLAATSDATNYYEIDWIAIGRPAPGASSAELDAERAARISADNVIAQDVVALDTRMNASEGVGAANAAAIGGLTTRVTNTETGQTALAQRADDLETTVNHPDTGLPATAGALGALVVRVDTLDDGSQTAQAGDIRELRSDLRRLAGEVLDGLSNDELRRLRLSRALATARRELNTRVDLTDAQLLAVAEAVTELQAQIPGLATADALNLLVARVTATETSLTTQSQSLTRLASRLTGAENVGATNATAISGLTTRVTDAEGAITSQGQQLTHLTSGLAGAEGVGATNATAISGLTTRVTDAEGAITSQGQQLTQLTSGLAGAEGVGATNATAISGLTTRVTDAEGAITSQSQQLTQLTSGLAGAEGVGATNATAISGLTTRVTDAEGDVIALTEAFTSISAGTVGGNLGTATYRMSVQTGPTGYARIGAEARVGAADTWRSAGWYLDVPNNAALPTLFAVKADAFAVTDGTNQVTPFAYANNQMRLRSELITLDGNVTVDGSFKISTGTTGARTEVGAFGVRVFAANGQRIIAIGDLT